MRVEGCWGVTSNGVGVVDVEGKGGGGSRLVCIVITSSLGLGYWPCQGLGVGALPSSSFKSREYTTGLSLSLILGAPNLSITHSYSPDRLSQDRKRIECAVLIWSALVSSAQVRRRD